MSHVDEWRRSILVERHWAGGDLPGLTDEQLDVVFKESASARDVTPLLDAQLELEQVRAAENAIEAVLDEVRERMRAVWPTMADWNVVAGQVEILDEAGNVIATVKEEEMDKFYE